MKIVSFNLQSWDNWGQHATWKSKAGHFRITVYPDWLHLNSRLGKPEFFKFGQLEYFTRRLPSGRLHLTLWIVLNQYYYNHNLVSSLVRAHVWYLSCSDQNRCVGEVRFLGEVKNFFKLKLSLKAISRWHCNHLKPKKFSS